MSSTWSVPAAVATVTLAAALGACTDGGTSLIAHRDSTVSRFVGRPLPKNTRWQTDRSPRGQIWRGDVPGIGVFTTDGQGSIVLTAVLTHNPAHHGPELSENTLLARARAFAVSQVPGIDKMVLYTKQPYDRGVETVFVAIWRGRSGQAWLPTMVSVGVTVDGTPVEFGYNPTSVGAVDTTPSVDATAAERAALSAVGQEGRVRGTPELDVVQTSGGTSRLAWVVELEAGRAPSVPTLLQVLVDAHTGRVVGSS